MDETNRIKWIDYSKGIGILLVVIAHALAKDNLINIYSYSFHLPLFFILSGITLKEDRILEERFVNVVIRNVKSILVPYYFYAMFVVMIELLKNILQNDMTVGNTLEILTRWIFMTGLKADWFLPCLFFSKIIFVGIYRLMKNNRNSKIVLLVFSFIIMSLQVRPLVLRPILCAGIGAFFVGIGHSLRSVYNKFNKVSYIVVAIVWVITTMLNGKVSLLIYNFGKSGILYLINGILGSVVVIGVTRIIEKNFGEVKVLGWLGKNSLIIMVVHMEIMAFINAVLAKNPVVNDNVFLLETLLIVITLIASVVLTPLVNKIYNIIFKKGKSGGK